MTPMWLLTVGAVGATLIITLGSIFAWLRRLFEFTDCPQCSGFWVGVMFGVAGGMRAPVDVFAFACAISLISLLTEAALHRITRLR